MPAMVKNFKPKGPLMANECLADIVKRRRKILAKKEGIEEEIVNHVKSSKECEELKEALEQGNIEKVKSILLRIANYAPHDYLARVSVQDASSKKVLCKVGHTVTSIKPGIVELSIPSNGSYVLKVEASPAADVESSFSAVWLGLEASGKSTLIERIRQDEFVTPQPTVGLNVTSSVFEGIKLVNCDISGHRSFRSIWDSLIVGNPDIAIYVVDGSEHSTLNEAQALLTNYVLKAEALKGIPLLIAVNKQDIEGAVSGEQLNSKFDLCKLVQGREWSVVHTSAKTGEGILDMLRWMMDQIKMRKGVGSQ